MLEGKPKLVGQTINTGGGGGGGQTSNVIVEPNFNFTWPIHDLLNQTITLYL